MKNHPIQLLDKWLRDMPGGRFLPDDILTTDFIEILVSGGDKDRLLWQLFTESFSPIRHDEEGGQVIEEGDVYLVPRIVLDCLEWYGGDENWWAEEL